MGWISVRVSFEAKEMPTRHGILRHHARHQAAASGRWARKGTCPSWVQKLLSLGDSGKVVGSRGGVVGHLYNYFFLVVFLIGIAIVVLASEFGWRLGIRTKGHGASGNISALEQSLLGLLALIVGFTFLMALTRFEARREAVLNEANAICSSKAKMSALSKVEMSISAPFWEFGGCHFDGHGG